MELAGRADFLCPFIWIHASGLTRFHNRSDKGTASNFVQLSDKSAMETLAVIRQAFEEESMSHTWVFEWCDQFRASPTSTEDDQCTGRPISSTVPNIVAKLNGSFMKLDVEPLKT
jgi:hypothetical protein